MNLTNLEIEQALIGRMLISEHEGRSGYDLSEHDFSESLHWEVFAALQSGKNLRDYATGKDYEYLRTLADSAAMPLIPGQDDYAEILKELGIKRRLYALMQESLDTIETTDSAEILGALNNEINSNITTPKLKTRADVRKEIRETLELPKACYATSFGNLNTAMGGGFYEGYTYGFCGKEKMGKTTIAHTISHTLGCKHLYIAMEMGATQIEQRNMAKDMNINSLKFLDAPLELKNRAETLQASDNVIYFDAPGANLEEILHNIGMAIVKYGIKGFILDYWQLVTGQNRGESEERHLRRVAQGLADYARKQKIWCVLLAQMNKDGQLFGGNGLRKACDQLYMINECEGIDTGRWLAMDASRYTYKADIGSEGRPAVILNTKTGPYFEEVL